jgi:acyl-coenzyme A synthetase/AMP-(fatty) acid ligase
MPFLAGAASILVPEPPNPAVVIGNIEHNRCTMLFAQPRFLAETISADPPAQALNSLRVVISGGEPLAPIVLDRWAQAFQAELLDSYGSTELGFLYISNRLGTSRKGSVGQAVEGMQIEVVDDQMNRVPPNRIGRLRVRGPMMIDGYWNDSERSRQSFKDGWFVTSDLFSVDDDGFFYIHGRADHMVKLGCGDWVNPVELETVLLEHPRVSESAVTGASGAGGLTALKAFVVAKGPPIPDEYLARDIARLVRDRWPRQEFKHIAAVQFVSSLPKTTAGKLDRAKLGPQSMTEFSYKC